VQETLAVHYNYIDLLRLMLWWLEVKLSVLFQQDGELPHFHNLQDASVSQLIYMISCPFISFFGNMWKITVGSLKQRIRESIRGESLA
jgi:hypothetical protein